MQGLQRVDAEHRSSLWDQQISAQVARQTAAKLGIRPKRRRFLITEKAAIVAYVNAAKQAGETDKVIYGRIKPIPGYESLDHSYTRRWKQEIENFKVLFTSKFPHMHPLPF
jgi:hypothetical protein